MHQNIVTIVSTFSPYIGAMIGKMIRHAAKTKPRPLRLLTIAEKEGRSDMSLATPTYSKSTYNA
jgi:hypothetical protein